MHWTKKYWDAVQQIYWTPAYIGLESIPQRFWEVSRDKVSVPIAMTNPNGPLYRRTTNSKAFPNFIRQKEEPFNHIFDLTFGILDGTITNDILCDLLGRWEQDSLVSYGRELGDEFGFPDLYSKSQHDSFFVGNNWTVAVELKFDAKTGLDQLAKYLLSFAVERLVNTKRKPVSLIYIAPKPEQLLDKAFPFPVNEIGPHLLDSILADASPSVLKPLQNIETTAAEILEDLSVTAFSWGEFDSKLQDKISSTSIANADGRTVIRLLQGLSNEICSHPLSGCTDAN